MKKRKCLFCKEHCSVTSLPLYIIDFMQIVAIVGPCTGLYSENTRANAALWFIFKIFAGWDRYPYSVKAKKDHMFKQKQISCLQIIRCVYGSGH